jgi:hypothetical protein
MAAKKKAKRTKKASTKGYPSNVERLVQSGLLVKERLTAKEIGLINQKLGTSDIEALEAIGKKLGIKPAKQPWVVQLCF